MKNVKDEEWFVRDAENTPHAALEVVFPPHEGESQSNTLLFVHCASDLTYADGERQKQRAHLIANAPGTARECVYLREENKSLRERLLDEFGITEQDIAETMPPDPGGA